MAPFGVTDYSLIRMEAEKREVDRNDVLGDFQVPFFHPRCRKIRTVCLQSQVDKKVLKFVKFKFTFWALL